MNGQIKLIALTIILVGIYFFFHDELTREEQNLRAKILYAQNFLWRELETRNLSRDEISDSDKSGFIGVEYSPITTTMGSLEAKQNSTNPLWGVQFLRWFDELKLSRGDKVIISASSSFPAMVYACVAACELRGLDCVLLVSLGSSTWGANRPEFIFSEILNALRSAGFMKTRTTLYTLGGENENADNMPEDGREILLSFMKKEANFIIGRNLQEIIDAKAKYLDGAKVFINIGGNASSMGVDLMSLNIPAGLVKPSQKIDAGNGLAGIALRKNIPVIHVLNLKGLAQDCGIDFYSRRKNFMGTKNIFAEIFGLALFFLVMIFYKRWSFENDIITSPKKKFL